jgi:translation initiation factor IF-2
MAQIQEKSIARPPIVAVMGHIDHGKSTLLDYIRKTNIVETEAGGITQRISAYEVAHKREDGSEQKITFLDTPGHQAFQAMRSRGAAVADIAILVVSAEDGVKPQTIEALNTILSAKIPYIVAINKIDKPQANVEKTKQTLSEAGIYLEGYGGNIPFVPISAKHGDNIPDLLSMILLVSDLEGLTGDMGKNAEGVVIESSMDPKKGITATIIVTDGKLQTGEFAVSNDSICPLRMIEDFSGKKIEEATFSSPIRLIGWSTLPKVGAEVNVVKTKKEAEELVKICRENNKCCTEDECIPDGAIIVPILIKTDVAGMADAVLNEVKKLTTDKVFLRIISSEAGPISENDIKRCLPFPGTIILGFNASVDSRAKDLAEQNSITIEAFSIIYKLTEWLEEEIIKRTPKSEVEEVIGTLQILKNFSQVKDRQVVGGKVVSGRVTLGNVRVIRRESEIGRGEIIEIQQSKIKTKEVTEGECGLMVESKITLAPSDKLEAIVKVVK